MQAADKLIELEDKLKQTGKKKNESKSGSNKDKTSFFAQRETIVDNGSESDLPRTESEPDLNESLLSDESEMGNAKPD
jgi:hypothetical protein